MQNIVKEFNNQKRAHKKPIPISARLLDIQSEIGELCKEYLKETKYGILDNQVVSQDFIMEFEDVLYSLLSLAEETKINAEEALNLAIEKYKKRLAFSNQMGSNS